MGRPHPTAIPSDEEPTSDVYETVRTTGPTIRGLRLTAPMIGGRYEVREMLGVGGMGTVVAALDTVTGKEVALKILQSSGSRDTAVRRLRREAETAMQVEGGFVCRVDGFSIDPAAPFMVMERLRGETLRTRLRRDGPLPFDAAIDIVSQLLDALDVVHEAGVIHRDVKPANVFLAGSTVKLIDFGVATRAGRSAYDARVDSMKAFGTLDYLPPERLLEHEDIDHRVDIWAAGCTLFAALTGRPPFVRDDWQAQLEATVLEDPPLVSEWRSDVPPLVDDVIRMALAKERERRFASARAFRAALVAAAR